MDKYDSQSSFDSDSPSSTTSYDNEFVMNFEKDISINDNNLSIYLHRAEMQSLHIMMKFSLPNEAHSMVTKWAKCVVKDGFDFDQA